MGISITEPTSQSLPAHERYVEKPFFGSSHSWLLRHLESIPLTSRVLDVGSGSGLAGRFLRDRGVEEVFAVEVDAQAAQSTAQYYRTIAPELSAYRGQHFDVILLMDVLEHMTDPFAYFQQLRSMLALNGKILISVPNIAHWSVRLMLLFGYFSYTERGILDSTHYQHFTRKRFVSLWADMDGIIASELTASIEPFELLLPPLIWKNPVYSALARARLALARLWPGLFAYQHLALLCRQK